MGKKTLRRNLGSAVILLCSGFYIPTVSGQVSLFTEPLFDFLDEIISLLEAKEKSNGRQVAPIEPPLIEPVFLLG
jgi:hypothetical protein